MEIPLFEVYHKTHALKGLIIFLSTPNRGIVPSELIYFVSLFPCMYLIIKKDNLSR